MNVSSISSSSNSYAVNSGGYGQKWKDFKSLASALQSNNLQGAQSAFSALQSDLQNTQVGTNSPFLDPNSQLGKDFTALQNALSSNDLKSAQSAFATLRQDLQSVQGTKGHHHHKVDNDGDADDGENSSKTGVSSTDSTNPPQTGSALNVTA